MLNYLITVLFKPKKALQSWYNKFHPNNYEESMLLFVMIGLLIVASELIYAYITINLEYSYNTIIFSYLEIIISTVLIYFAMWIEGVGGETDMPKLKWLNVFFLSTGGWLIITNFFFAILRDLYLHYYLILSFCFQLISAYYLSIGFEVCDETKVNYSKKKSRFPIVFRYLVILVICKFIGSIISGRYFV